MKNEIHRNTSSQFLKTDGGKTKTKSIDIPSISLPKGGGAIKGIDEKFSVNAANGTATLSFPLPFSPARGTSPSLSINYNSGAGNNFFGLGWRLGLSTIKRKTEKELPQYMDIGESDTFIMGGAEDLVAEFKKRNDGTFDLDTNGDYIINERYTSDGLFLIRYYKPRIEGSFAQIERWTEKVTNTIKWRVISRDNVITFYGWSNNSVISDPQDQAKIFEWFPEFTYDDKGNCCQYIYKKEDEKGFDNTLLHNKNRLKSGNLLYTNLYPEKILHGNKTPYKTFGDPFPQESDYMFQTIFDYGEYNGSSPYLKVQDWDFRKDAFSDYKSGFEIRTTRLCKRVLLLHFFNELPGGSALVKSLDFDYDTSQLNFSFLKSITSVGYIKKEDGTYSSKKLPPIEFEYQKHAWNKDVKSIASEDLVHAPIGLEEPYYQFTDLFNEGLSGILTEQANGWYYKHNLGDGKFGRSKLITPKPSFMGLGSRLQLADLDADGGKQLVSYEFEPQGYFELDDDDNWQRFKNFRKVPNIEFSDINARMLDLNGDGKPEILITEDNTFTWYKSEGRNGFGQAQKKPKSFDEEAGPNLIFADEKQTIFLADMSGDGLTDLVRIRNGETCYWPNLGYGKFGAKVAMDNAPVFDHPDTFSPDFLRLADIDGSGTTDIIYLGKNSFTCWMNLSGNAFSTNPFIIDSFPEIHSQADITVTDLLGNGVACIVWSDILPKNASSPLKYIDLINSRKPHLLVAYKNNLGKEVSFEYTASTKFYINDKLAGKPWVTKLHFPVHCISKTETLDKISGWRFVSSYKYHHGYYDHAEQEFRGFGMVEQTDSEDFEHWTKGNASNIVEENLHQEPVVSKTWFHTGAFLRNDNILNQFSHEYWFEEVKKQGYSIVNPEEPLADARIVRAPGIPNAVTDHLSPEERQQAFRACKGMMLRSEVFAYDAPENATDDQLKKQLTPYSVEAHNCVIELLQPKGKNKYAVFLVKESEAITYSYERNTEDPRIAHHLNISMDELGNVLESAAVVYPKAIVNIDLPIEIQAEQNKTVIIYTRNKFTNDVAGDDVYRLRMPSEVKAYELKGVTKNGSYYTTGNFENILALAHEVPYHHIDSNPGPGSSQKRLIEHIRTCYYKNDLTSVLPLNSLEYLAIPYESYQMAYSPDLLSDIFGSVNVPVDDQVMAEGKFIHSPDENGVEDSNWWIRSGTNQFIAGSETAADAQNRFYLPISSTDPFGTNTTIKYDENYHLFIEVITDALGNRSGVDLFNFRTLLPQRIRDINNNLSGTISDELGMVKAIAVFGKGGEADDLAGIEEYTDDTESDLIHHFFNVPSTVEGVTDSKGIEEKANLLLKHATVRFIYDPNVYKDLGKPVVAASIAREEHFRKNNHSPVQLSFEYSNGSGNVIMKKVQAEPGLAKKVTVHQDETYTIDDINTAALTPSQLRWIGNGRTIINNKGNVVKQYEPYFSVTNQFEDLKELVETGLTPVMFYDAMSRLVKTEMPDGTLSRTTFNSWQKAIFDSNDTVLESKWYNNRTNRLIDAELLMEGKDPVLEKSAADKAAKHANTPFVAHLDSLGNPVLLVEHNKNVDTDANEFLHTKALRDVEGNLRRVVDAREIPENSFTGNAVMQYKYDMLGNLVYQNSIDAGQRWLFTNVLGNSLRTWDERNHEFRYFYDTLHRPLYTKVIGGDGAIPLQNIFERVIYGENLLMPDRSNESTLQSVNILGKTVKIYDTGGGLFTPEYDFKGLPKSSTRKLFKNYKAVADWTDANLGTDLENDEFTFTLETDALGRIVEQKAPDGSTTIFGYNEAGLLNSQSVNHVNPALTTTYIRNIDYNEKGNRTRIEYGNDVFTQFYYDRKTFGLIRLETKRSNNDPLQDWHYTFDPAGNITHIADTNIPVTFFDNQKITGLSEYTYDAVYRLSVATGRENDAALNFDEKDNWNDSSFMQEMNPGDPMAVRNYVQSYRYDEVGNIRLMKHIALNNSWTRNYTYETSNNRLKSTQIGSETYTYTHHPLHGFMQSMPHLQQIEWNFKEQLALSIRQKVNPGSGTPEITYYQYDGQGQRIRKITENSASTGLIPTIKDERIYISAYETFRTYQANIVSFERETLNLLDQGHRFVMIETVKQNKEAAPPPSERIGDRFFRYQFHNHIGSAALELDESAQVISYEEYHPYGTTAFQAKNASIKATAKRYRYTGMERDEETGLEYHSARYYMPWLGRWLSADPDLSKYAAWSPYCYAFANPMIYNDNTGKGPSPMDVIMKEVENWNSRFTQFIKIRADLETINREMTALVPERGTTLNEAERGQFNKLLKQFNEAQGALKTLNTSEQALIEEAQALRPRVEAAFPESHGEGTYRSQSPRGSLLETLNKANQLNQSLTTTTVSENATYEESKPGSSGGKFGFRKLIDWLKGKGSGINIKTAAGNVAIIVIISNILNPPKNLKEAIENTTVALIVSKVPELAAINAKDEGSALTAIVVAKYVAPAVTKHVIIPALANPITWVVAIDAGIAYLIFMKKDPMPFDVKRAERDIKAYQEGHNVDPFCNQCHGKGGFLDPARKWDQLYKFDKGTLPEFNTTNEPFFKNVPLNYFQNR